MKLKHFLLTALILFTGVGGVYATKLYVGFTAGSTHTDLQTALDAAKNGRDTVFVATGLCIANNGYGVATGQGGGKMINNTITANTYSPVFSKIPGTPTGQLFQMYKGSSNVITINHRPTISGGLNSDGTLSEKCLLEVYALCVQKW